MYERNYFLAKYFNRCFKVYCMFINNVVCFSGLLLFGRSPKKARQMEHQIRNRQVLKEYVCRVDGKFPE